MHCKTYNDDNKIGLRTVSQTDTENEGRSIYNTKREDIKTDNADSKTEIYNSKTDTDDSKSVNAHSKTDTEENDKVKGT